MTDDTVAVLEFAAVSAAYADDRTVLQEVSLQVRERERVALVGPNGAGKSTVLLVATGLIAPTRGGVRVKGVEMRASNTRELRAGLGFVFADPDDMLLCETVLDEVMFGPLQMGVARDVAEQNAKALLGQLRLSEHATRAPLHLSLGEKKRLAMAAVLASQPAVCLLDEPTTGLDPRSRRDFLAGVMEMPNAVLMATHDLDAVWDLDARVILLDGGRVVCEGAAREILRDEALLQAHGLELPLRLQRD